MMWRQAVSLKSTSVPILQAWWLLTKASFLVLFAQFVDISTKEAPVSQKSLIVYIASQKDLMNPENVMMLLSPLSFSRK